MNKPLSKFFLISLILGVDLAIFSQVNQAQSINPRYECIVKNDIPITFVTTKRGIVELITWQSEYFSNSDWTPEKRCQAVTERFQVYSDSGLLRYVTYGEINQQKVICVGEKNNQPEKPYQCKTDSITVNDKIYNSVLLTLEPKDDPAQVLQELFNISARVNYGGVTRGGSTNNSPTFVDLDRVLQQKPVIEVIEENN